MEINPIISFQLFINFKYELEFIPPLGLLFPLIINQRYPVAYRVTQIIYYYFRDFITSANSKNLFYIGYPDVSLNVVAFVEYLYKIPPLCWNILVVILNPLTTGIKTYARIIGGN